MPQTETFSLSRFVSLLKNVRAVAFLDPDASVPEEELKWLRKKYQYRSLGVSSRLLESLPKDLRAIFERKPYVRLTAPTAEIEALTSLISDYHSSVPTYVFDSIIMASCYVNPLLVIGRESYDALRELTAWALSSSSELPDVEIKRNTRIIGYAILDFHEKVTSETYENLRDAISKLPKRKEAALRMVKKIVEKRKKLAQKDGEHRFWRLLEKGKMKERVVIAYVDTMPVIARALSEAAEAGFKETSAFRLVSHIGESGPDMAMALSLVPAFIFEL
jgi:hypothetical protein